ncbi:MAG: hypothetical protein IKP10_05430 [Clostridia bacterium]|nr:hypothetical protein [Clostridia bacterium]
MKKVLGFAMALSLLFSLLISVSSGENGTWVCPSCGATSSGNFCSNCGTKKPASADDAAVRNVSDGVSLTIHIDFDENIMFSTYDVEMYLDDALITKMAHGKNYDGSVNVSIGKHTIRFFRSGSSSVTGSCEIDVAGPSAFSCNIHANSEKVTVRSVKLTASEGSKSTYINGQTELVLTVDFRKNAAFSTYDVDMFCDDILIATLPHGEGYHGVLKVSDGIHVISFFETGSKSKSGKTEFSIHGDSTFSCHIEATRNGIDVTDEKLNDGSSLISKSDYTKACTVVQYTSVERNPEQYKGKKIKVTGKVIQVMESGSNSVVLRVSESDDKVWYVTYKRANGESRILEDDRVTIYGECSGIVTYTTVWGSSVTVPGVNAVYIDR